MTEKDAASRWCPMVRQWESTGAAYNCDYPEGRNPYFSRCIGRECACWVWDYSPKSKDDGEGHCGLCR